MCVCVCVCAILAQLDDSQLKLQKDVNDARHGIDFVMVSPCQSLYTIVQRSYNNDFKTALE